MRSVALGLAILAACGGPSATGGAGGTGGVGGGGQGGKPFAPTDAFHSGSRLVIRGYDLGGGVRAGVDVFDTVLAERCSAQLATDGIMRCIPIGPWIGYLDAACTEPVAEVDCDSPPTVHAVVELPAQPECEAPRNEVHLLGSPIAPPNTVYGLGSSCFDLWVSDDATYHALGDVVPPATFAPLEEFVVPRGDLAAQYWRSEDGAYWVDFLRDVVHGVPCRPALLDGEVRCVPKDGSDLLGPFADASCTVPVVLFETKCGEPVPEVATAWGTVSRCIDGGTTAQAASVGAALPVTYHLELAECVPTELPPGVQAFALDPGLPATLFPLLDQQLLGAGPVGRFHFVDGVEVAKPEILDPFSTTRCRREETSAGPKCMPSSFPYNDAFSIRVDPVCKQPVLWAPAAAGCSFPLFSQFVTSPTGCGTQTQRAWEIGAQHDGPYFEGDPESCLPATSYAPFPQHLVGPEVPLALFSDMPPLITL